MTLKSEIRSADYRAKAASARDAAHCASLNEVRRRHEAAALVWDGLADREALSAATARSAIARRDAIQVARGAGAAALRDALPVPASS